MSNHVLRYVYHSRPVKNLARKAAAADRRRQRLLKRYSRVQAALNSRNPLPWLAPIRRHYLATLTYKLERNLARHRHRATRLALKEAIKQNTIKAAYELVTNQEHD